jgi:hypothetical protein
MLEQPLVEVEEEASPIDKLLEQVGGNGTYQQLTFLVHGIHWFVLGWVLVGMSFYFETRP